MGEGPRDATIVLPEALFRAHAGFVARFLFRMGVAVDDIDDAVQDVFVVVHQLGGYRRGAASERGFLASIATRVASNARRRSERNRARTADGALDGVSATRPNPAQALQLRQDLALLQQALDALPPEDCSIFVLVELEGQACTDIARSTRTPIGTVYWRLFRARKRFKAMVQQLEEDLAEPVVGQTGCPS